MTLLAPLLERFFTQRLLHQRRASSNTIAAYRDAFRLLLRFLKDQRGTMPSQVTLAQLDADLVAAFLAFLEKDRGNAIRSRNARLAAIHSFFHFVAFEEPAHSASIQRVLAIPHKRTERKLVEFLVRDEIEALLHTPDRSTALVFKSRRSGMMSRDAVECLVTKYVTLASSGCPTLKNKHVSPHTLRHTSAMQLLTSGVDRTVLALWLGHESIETTEIYVHADLGIKERAIARTAPLPTAAKRYKPADPLLAFLEGL